MNKTPVLLLLSSISLISLASCEELEDSADLDEQDEFVFRVHPLDDSKAAVPANSVEFANWPLSGSSTPDKIISPFGPRCLTDQSGCEYDFHSGLDLWPALAESEPDETTNIPIYVVANGRVHSVASSQDDGYTVVVKHLVAGGVPATNASEASVYYTRYNHLHAVTVSQNAVVNAGSSIGTMGTSDGGLTHLHFEVRGRNYLFYSLNPLRWLPRSQANDSAPEILMTLSQTGCEAGSDRFWVRHETDAEEIDVSKVTVTVTPLCGQGSPVTKTMDIERRENITLYDDLVADNLINPSTENPNGCTPWGTSEYCVNALLADVAPVFEDCGSPTRNHFNWNSESYTSEVRFSELGVADGGVLIEADVTDVDGNTESASPIIPCQTSDDCQAIVDYSEGCSCKVGAACEPPTVPGNGTCEVSPCLNETAVCEANVCVLVAD